MLLLCTQPSSPISFHTKKVLNQVCKRSPYNWSLCCLALFLAQEEKKMYFFIVELLKRLHSLLVLTKKGYKGEGCSNCCTCIIIPVSKNSQPAFSFSDSPEGCKARTTISGAFLWKYLTSLL